MDADAAGILGLLLGGAGGYYGGKKRAEREASDMEKLIAMYRGEDDKDETTTDNVEYTPPEVENALKFKFNKEGSSVGEPIVLFPESLQNIERSPEDYLGAEAAGLLDYRFGDPVIDFNPEETAMNKLLRLGPSFYDYNLGKKDGGRIGYEPGGKVSLKDKLIYGGTGAGLYELFGHLPAINDYINFINFNQGGRVGYEQGGIVDLYKRMNHG